ncbi:hypothetical protein SAMN05444266_102213 [Chitinophaga jiangningensis]|uniref:Uncharacterized protein n=1 Tax=Chitinophaga jiangningensis TaxID=1419482 RepID=A0A1M6Y9D0_9BACT|nr:hypothetical protein [Chitinophaga jiangningensis]SHL14861.1 hypothetical protein SAMN05444266_102213 [Chitinophaga jiangningensis]
MSIQDAVQRRDALLQQSGKEGLNVMYPKEFEQYICALELVDTAGNTLRYFIFPVMPSNMDESQPKPTSFKRTLGGIVTMSSTTFSPVDITLSGNFGRKFRVMLGGDYTDMVSAVRKSDTSSNTKTDKDASRQVFDDRVKTGYGCLKVMEELITEADRVDEAGPRFLIFYNLAFGNSYYVKPVSFKISMSEDNNMLHQYALALKAIAPLEVTISPVKRYENLEMARRVHEEIAASANRIDDLIAQNDQHEYTHQV